MILSLVNGFHGNVILDDVDVIIDEISMEYYCNINGLSIA